MFCKKTPNCINVWLDIRNMQSVAKKTIVRTRSEKNNPEIINDVCNIIIKNFAPKKIVLFGSYAYGKASQHSDIDLLVLVDENSSLARLIKRDRYGEILKLFLDSRLGIDAIVLTTTELQTIIDENEGEWDLILEILEEGKTLYEYHAD